MIRTIRSSATGFLLVAALLCGSLLCITLTAQQAAATTTNTQEQVGNIFSAFLDSQTGIGPHVKSIMQLIGVIIILFTLFKNFGNAVKNGAGIMSVLPSILVGCLAGGVLMSPSQSAKFLGWIVQMMSDASSTITGWVGTP